ncbi:hypothetical protein [Phenylobacterium immobile]|uniref:hypothetical protein n=1 Tax=Phenylobacterium immobile TaxID=21 RepID=UPI000A930C89|nr:hypothetical protein [Phenylobacterium immobile]
MFKKALTAAVCFAAVSVGACSGPHKPMAANSKICADFKAPRNTAATTTIADAAAPLDECLRRWAYSLAPSKDEADYVSDAAVAACSGALARWNQESLTDSGGEEAMSITTGQPTNPLAEHNAFAHNRALFYVVQARAGRCSPPGVKDGVPVGVSG